MAGQHNLVNYQPDECKVPVNLLDWVLMYNSQVVVLVYTQFEIGNDFIKI